MLRILTVIICVIAFTINAQVDLSVFKSMKMRQVGPAGMSGRVTCIDVVESNPSVIYLGAASGGVWKSTSGGTTWEPVADTMPTLNIGALAIQQSNPSVVWVGTGEGNPRNSQSSGGGLYRTLDAGRTWDLIGLEETKNIHRIIIHPNDPNTVWIGAQGPAWGDNENRGVYKTIDGGKTWRLVLKGNSSTGIGDLVIDPNNPNKLIANMWDFRRDPWIFRSGGEGSGLHITVDGGETWKKLTSDDGIPKGDLGRIGLAIAPSNSNRVYAKVEAEKNELYRSDDGGFNWYKISSDKNAGDRPFYYSDIFVDPENENRIYSLWSRVSRSEDGGKTWQIIIPYSGVHPDHHAFWVHPKNPSHIIIGNDGGIAISMDKANTWRFVKNLPVAQYYHINIDNEMPYNIYGGMQDNGSWRGPAYVWAAGGIRNAYFQEVMFGDGFDVSPDPDNSSRYGYAMSQGGSLGQYDLLTGRTKYIQPTHDSEEQLRFNWNAPLAQDPFNNSTIYYGAQYVFKSEDKGDSWTRISPDLTTNDSTKQKQLESGGLTLDVTGAENYTTLTVIEPSPLDKNMIWTGSDDGRIHLTRNGGETWESMESRIKGMPKGAWVTQIQASKHSKDEVFVVVNDYRRNNWKPYLFTSKNGGKSWLQIVDSEDVEGYCLSVIQDPVESNLIFLGTENGLFVSTDGGEKWNKWNHGYPNVSTMDMKIQERENDLVIGTFGRAAYVLDDISPLRNLAKNGIDKWNEDSLVMFEVPDAYMVSRKRAPGVRFGADATWSGDNRTTAARVQLYYIGGKKKKTKAKMLVLNSKNDTIRTMKVDLEKGVNRLNWYLDQKRVRSANQPKPKKEERESGGFPVSPGEYTIIVNVGELESEAKVSVFADPRIDYSDKDFEEQERRFIETQELMKSFTEICDEYREYQKVVKRVNGMLPAEKDSLESNLFKSGKKLNDSVQAILDNLLGKKDVKGIYRNPKTPINIIQNVSWEAWSTPQDDKQRYEHKMILAQKELEKAKKLADEFSSTEWEEYKKKVQGVELSPFQE